MSLLRNLIKQFPTATSRGSTAMMHRLLPFTQTPPNTLHNQIPPHRHHYSTSPTHQMRTSTSLSSKHLPSSPESLIISDKAKTRLKEVLEEGSFLRVIVDSGGCSGFMYKFEIDKQLEEEDVQIHSGKDDTKPLVVIDQPSLDILKGATVDYEMELIRSGFRILNIPAADQGCSFGASFNVKI